MSLTPGSRIGPYEVLAPLGAGGMGEVYRARDTRLNRIVAVKAMQESLAQQPERAARFEREAQLLASLNHPNIAAIHGVEEAHGSTYLVLEFVDGRSLSDVLLQSGALPLADALAIARQIADALAAAHERGIIHRDLKPGNVMLTADGQVKVLDFGLAKAVGLEGVSAADAPASNSPTMTMAGTQAGIILGTASYMSPEQAKGRVADKRSDVWAFGCVLYELVTGKRAFDGEDVTEILAAVVRGEPDWQALPAAAPPAIRELLQGCLIKNRAERLADMSVVQFLLKERARTGSMPIQLEPSARTARSIGVPVVAGLVALAVIATVAVMTLWPRAATAPASSGGVLRLSIALPDADEMAWTNELPLALSPDGTLVAYSGLRDGKVQLFVRALGEFEPRMIVGTDGAKSPFFSPDGRWIGFFAQGKVKKVTVGGAAVQDLAEAPDARGGAWSADDTIYFAPTNVSGIWKVPASGGKATELTRLDRAQGEISHRWPHILPDNQAMLFTVWTGPGPDERHIVQQSLNSDERHVLVSGGDTPRYVSPGYLVYGRLDALFAVPWKPGQKSLSGAVPVTLPETPRLENEGASDYTVSTNGTFAYLSGGQARLAQRVVWVDPMGRTQSLPLPPREYESVAISPDGRRAMVQIQDSVVGLWLYDFDRQTLTPFLSTGASSQAPVWTRDGKYVIYRGTRNGFRNLYMKAADGTGAEERLTTKENVSHTPTSVSPDGQWVVFNEGGGGSKTGTAVWRVRLNGDRTPQPLLQNGECDGQISPDGKWLAYQSTTDPSSEIFIQPYPGPGPRQQISVGGGVTPLWSRDGTELYYDSADRFMAVQIKTGPALSVGSPHPIFEGRYRGSINGNTSYDVSLDGRRFLRIQRIQVEPPVTRIDVVLHWFEELTKGQK